jgi:DNA-binding NarL/FixJ family response regulator
VTFYEQLVHERMGGEAPTAQQLRVLNLAAEGRTYKEIATELYISESTVRFHIQKLKVKLGARTKTELITMALRKGMVAPAADEADPAS